MADDDILTKYEEARDSLSPRFRIAMQGQHREITDSYLLMYPELDHSIYTNQRHFTKAACDSFLLWLMVEGYVILSSEQYATEAERVEAAENVVKLPVQQSNNHPVSPTVHDGPYL